MHIQNSDKTSENLSNRAILVIPFIELMGCQGCKFLFFYIDTSRNMTYIHGSYMSTTLYYRLTVAYLALSAVDLLGQLTDVQSDSSKIIDWVYSLQVEERDGM